MEELPGTALINGYGPTESTTFAACHRILAADVEGPIPIGRPISNTRIHILDGSLGAVPPGAEGELYVGGDGLARGYLGRPDLTAERFVPDPFGAPGSRLYRTGDLARLRPDGAIEFRGRSDQQVKIRGFRIEPGEIEAVLADHPGVAQAVVIVHQDAGGDKSLLAYVATRAGVNDAELSTWLGERLPEYLVPSKVVVLERLPLNANGKVDRSALARSAAPAGRRASTEDQARTPVETAIAGIFADVLGAAGVGRDESFFEAGGHSLRALRVLSRIRDAFGVELPQQSLFEAPTVGGLAAAVERARSSAAGLEWPPIRPVPRGGPLPLSFPQEQAWFTQQVEPDSLAYQFQARLAFSGPLSVTALERSLSEMVRRHEILRTSFPAANGGPVQEIHPPWTVDLPVVDLTALPVAEREGEAWRRLDEEVRRPFELGRLPLVRWTLLRLSREEHWLVHSEHHIIHDGWAFTVFLRELCQLYLAYAAGLPSPLKEPELQFADFAVWQRSVLAGPLGEKQRAYWRRKLAGAPPLLELPNDRVRPRQPTFRGAAPRFELSPELLEGLHRIGRSHDVTLFMSMLAAFLVLLHRYAGQDDICVGSGLANRRWRETEDLIGMMVNAVALRVDLAGDPTFGELLDRVRRTTLEAYANQDLPLASVVEALNPSRTLSHAPVYQVLFSFHDSPIGPIDLGGLTLGVREGVANGSAKYDMNVIVVPRGERVAGAGAGDRHGMTVIWEYSTDLFEPGTIDGMVGHYRRLLDAAVADPGRRISELPLLTAAEREGVLGLGTRAPAPFPAGQCVHELFEEQAAASPERPAVIGAGRAWTYAELDRRSEALARLLGEHGVGPDVPVGVGLERSAEAVAAFLGVLKAGGAYVPLDPGYPRERIQWMAQDAGIRVLVTETRHLEAFAGLEDATKVCLDRDVDVAEPRPVAARAPVRPENLAYVMYTSGSTGRPKGVCVPHRAVVRLVKGANYASLTGDEVFLLFAPLSFDASTLEIWGSLLNGGRLVVMPPGEAALEGLGRTISTEGVTTLWLTAGLFQEMVDSDLAALGGVRQLLAGGDVLSVAHVATALEGLPGCRLINGYGPTEGTTFTTCHPIDPQDLAGGRIPIGRPVSNTEVYILDGRLEPVPVGVPGEIYVGGAGLARGYLGRPDLTADRFIPNPHGPPGTRLYRTGDRARRLPDGRVDFLGRLDGQLKIRGFRIEPGEVEAVLREHPAVVDAAVVALADPAGDKRLAAYVVAVPGDDAGAPALRGWLRERLPDHMVPSQFVPLDRLPLTANGKLDRDALPAPTAVAPQAAGTDDHPRGPTEAAVASVFASVLGLERVGREQNFFELGGHSLKAVRLLSRVNESLGVRLPLRAVFDSPTVAGLATAVEAARAGTADNGMPSRPAITPSRRRGAGATSSARDGRPAGGGVS
jgi:amino acid adenylation domain-containing protein